MIEKTWFYTTNLKNYPELQETLLLAEEKKAPCRSYVLGGNVGAGKTRA